MNTIKSRIILAVLCAICAAYFVLLGMTKNDYAPVWYAILDLIMAIGFASSALALLSKGRFKFLNNIALFCIGLPALIFIGLVGWTAYQGNLDLTVYGVVKTLMCLVGIVAVGSVTEDEEARNQALEEVSD